jgi:aminopeptidase-like protein
MTLTVKALGGDADTLMEARGWLLSLAATEGEQAVLDMANRLRAEV